MVGAQVFLKEKEITKKKIERKKNQLQSWRGDDAHVSGKIKKGKILERGKNKEKERKREKVIHDSNKAHSYWGLFLKDKTDSATSQTS